MLSPTVPLKPLILSTRMFVKVEEPADKVWDFRLAEIAKFGVIGPARAPF